MDLILLSLTHVLHARQRSLIQYNILHLSHSGLSSLATVAPAAKNFLSLYKQDPWKLVSWQRLKSSSYAGSAILKQCKPRVGVGETGGAHCIMRKCSFMFTSLTLSHYNSFYSHFIPLDSELLEVRDLMYIVHIILLLKNM